MSITDNPISIQLDAEESITVPDAETWRVTVWFFVRGGANFADISINGLELRSEGNPTGFETVLTEGDEIETDDDARVHIGGFSI